jgi:hypothetical protein
MRFSCDDFGNVTAASDNLKGLVTVLCNEIDLTYESSFLAAYETSNDVSELSRIDLDVLQIDLFMRTRAYDLAYSVYQNGRTVIILSLSLVLSLPFCLSRSVSLILSRSFSLARSLSLVLSFSFSLSTLTSSFRRGLKRVCTIHSVCSLAKNIYHWPRQLLSRTGPNFVSSASFRSSEDRHLCFAAD